MRLFVRPVLELRAGELAVSLHDPLGQDPCAYALLVLCSYSARSSPRATTLPTHSNSKKGRRSGQRAQLRQERPTYHFFVQLASYCNYFSQLGLPSGLGPTSAIDKGGGLSSLPAGDSANPKIRPERIPEAPSCALRAFDRLGGLPPLGSTPGHSGP